MNTSRFITLTKAAGATGMSAGDSVILNVADIVSCEDYLLVGGFIHEGTPNVFYRDDDKHQLHPQSKGSMLTLRGKDKKDVFVVQQPEEVMALIDATGDRPLEVVVVEV